MSGRRSDAPTYLFCIFKRVLPQSAICVRHHCSRGVWSSGRIDHKVEEPVCANIITAVLKFFMEDIPHSLKNDLGRLTSL